MSTSSLSKIYQRMRPLFCVCKPLLPYSAYVHEPVRRTNGLKRERTDMKFTVKCTDQKFMVRWGSNPGRSARHSPGLAYYYFDTYIINKAMPNT